MTAKVSFIIPHKGRFDMLEQTLESISLLDYPKENIEVAIVTQTPDLAEHVHLPKSLTSSIIPMDESETISTLRNTGVEHVSGDFIAFLDADIYLSVNWINTMQALLAEDKERVIVSAVQDCLDDAPPIEQIRTSLCRNGGDMEVSHLAGSNLFLTRDTFDTVGGFPDHLVTCEDYFFTDSAAKHGKLYFSSEATFIHLGEDKSFSHMFKKEIWRGQSNLQSIAGRKVPLREWPSILVPLAVFFFALLIIVACALSHWQGALLSLVLGLIPVCAYSIRLYLHANDRVSGWHAVQFYLYYFPARAIGTLQGFFKAIHVKQ